MSKQITEEPVLTIANAIMAVLVSLAMIPLQISVVVAASIFISRVAQLGDVTVHPAVLVAAYMALLFVRPIQADSDERKVTRSADPLGRALDDSAYIMFPGAGLALYMLIATYVWG